MIPNGTDQMTNAPYDKAIEEGAKVTGKVLDLVKDSAQPIANIYGLLIGDQIEAARHRRLDAIARRTKRILHERDLSETAEVAEQIAIPLLEAAQGEPREEMQELWARLLANAMDPARRDDVRPEFIAVLKQFHPVDAVILKEMGALRGEGWITRKQMAELTGLRGDSVAVSLRNLTSQGCLDQHESGPWTISDFGAELLLAFKP
jgi:hypothetical protein